jgi:hypothetical protein
VGSSSNLNASSRYNKRSMDITNNKKQMLGVKSQFTNKIETPSEVINKDSSLTRSHGGNDFTTSIQDY